MTKSIEKLTERQKLILNLIIEDYIKYGTPISSQIIIDEHQDLDLSSATIRNEMMVLEENGLIEKSNTVSGRVPTNLAYEWHLKNKKVNKNKIKEIKDKLNKIFEDRQSDINVVLEKSLSLINEATNTATITVDNNANASLEDIKTYQLDKNALIIIVLSNGKVINNQFSLNGLNYEDIKKAISILNERLKGTKIKDINKKLMSVKELVVEKISGLESKYQDLMKIIFAKLLNTEMRYSGMNNLMQANSFTDKETIQKLLHTLESQKIWDLIGKSKTIATDEDTNVILEMNDEVLRNVSAITRNLVASNSGKALTIIGAKNQDHAVLIELLNELDEKLRGW